jgi:ribonuclease HII
MLKNIPDFSYEKKLRKQGYKFIAGIDEVGRGCFAGPIVAGCVIFNKQISKYANKQMTGGVTRGGEPQSRGPLVGGYGAAERQDPEASEIIINDSKQLTPKQRQIADKWIRKNALAIGLGQASVSEINRLGIKKASEIAFRKAIKNCGKDIDYLLIDAFYIPYVKGLRRKNQLAIIKGDTKSVSIAAGSIIAKVYRDKIMTGLSKQSKYKHYCWGRNKGYGTKEHQNAIKKYGTTRQHRKQFVETWLSKSRSAFSSPVQ